MCKIGSDFWTSEEKENAWTFDLDYSEFKLPNSYDGIKYSEDGIIMNDSDEVDYNAPMVLYTGFAYYLPNIKKYKIGTVISVYQDRMSMLPSEYREIGPELERPKNAFLPMKIKIGNSTIYIPVIIAEYLTNVKIDEEWWTMFNNLVSGLLPESSASTKAFSTIAKLFGGKKIQTVEELIQFLDKIDESVKATELEEYGIEVLFRGTTRDIHGNLFSGNTNSVLNGASTSTDPIRAIIFGIESSSKPGRKGVLQIYVPKNLKGLNLQSANQYRFDLELEVIVNTSPENLSNFAIKEIPIEDARKLVEEVYGINLDTRITTRARADELLFDTKKLTLKESQDFYKKI